MSGYGTGPNNNVSLFNTQTEEWQTSHLQTDDTLGGSNVCQNSVVVSGQQAFQIAKDKHQNRRLIEITLEGGRVAYKTRQSRR